MEITAFLSRKLARRFRTYDSDGDGFIEREDFTQAGERTTKAFGLADDDPKAVRFHHSLIGLWDRLSAAADLDCNGRISVEEYKKAFTSGLLETQESFDEGYGPFLDALIAIADEDGDGKVTLEEHVTWTGALMNISERNSRSIHDMLSDEDGLLATQVMLDVIREFYFSEDPASSGNWLLGPLD